MYLIKKIIFVISLSLSCSVATYSSDGEDDVSKLAEGIKSLTHDSDLEYDGNKRIVNFVKGKNHNLDFTKATVTEPRSYWHPYAWVPLDNWRFIDRPLEDRDLQSTVIRGFLIGFSDSLIDCVEVFFHNFSHHGASQFGEQIGRDYVASGLTFAMSQIFSTLIYNYTAIANPFNFPGRATALAVMSYDATLDKKGIEKHIDNFVQENTPENFKPVVQKLLKDLRENKIIIADYMFDNVSGGEILRKISDYVEGKRSPSKFQLKKIADVAQFNPFDALNNELYKVISYFVQGFIEKYDRYTKPYVEDVCGFAAEYFVHDHLKEINFEPIKPFFRNVINSNFKNRYEELEKRLDPIYCEVGKQYAQNLVALSIEPVANVFSQNPLEFVTIKSKPDYKTYRKTKYLLDFVKWFKGRFPDQKPQVVFKGLPNC